jgi:hypothetical protein
VNILFPASPINPRLIDEAWAPEAQAAEAEGFTVGRVDLEAILGGEIRVRGLPETGPVLYRGWLMTPPRYQALHEHLGGRLVTGPVAYQMAYHLPEWLSLLLEGDTPMTLVIPGEVFDLKDVAERVWNNFQPWLYKSQQEKLSKSQQEGIKNGPRPVMVKDYLKSAKHRWFDACFIPDCRNLEDTMRVTKNFIDIQGDNLTGGLCFREFVECKPLGVHPRTQQPLVNEWRAFLRFGEVFSLRPYWGGQDYGPVSVPDAGIIEAMSKGLSKLPFVALDFAEKLDGGWVIFEVNDGGSAGIPDGLALPDFYQKLHKAFT